MAYTCPECGRELDDFEELQRHTETEHARDLSGGVVPVAEDASEGTAYGFDSATVDGGATEDAAREVRDAVGSAEREALGSVEGGEAGSARAASTNADASASEVSPRTGLPLQGRGLMWFLIADAIFIAIAALVVFIALD